MKQNKILAHWKTIAGSIAIAIMLIICFVLPILIIRGNWEITSISINDKTYDVQYNGYFFTDERVDSFTINGSFAFVDAGIVPYNDNYDYYMN